MTIEPISTSPLGVSRRYFLRSSLTVLAAPMISACGSGTGPQDDVNNPRLTARPVPPTVTPTIGLSELNLESGRDGLLYVPESYSPDNPTPLFVALHGAGGAADNWLNYYPRAETRGMILLAPESRGSSWDLIRLGRFDVDVKFIDRALQYTFDRCRIDPTRILFGGFSDGASYTLSLGVANGDLFSHLVGFSPGLWRPGEPTVGEPKIFVSHGLFDGVIPVSASRTSTVPRLQDAGYDVTYEEFEGGHEVPAAIGDAALDWFLGPSSVA